MSISNILSQKGSDVITVNENAPLREAISLLNKKNIGAVVVVNEQDQMCGILSERDIIRRALAQETGFRDEKVTKTMTKEVKSVAPESSIDKVMDIMTKSRIRHLPVLENNKLVGLVSIGDIVKRKIDEAEQEAEELRNYIATT